MDKKIEKAVSTVDFQKVLRSEKVNFAGKELNVKVFNSLHTVKDAEGNVTKDKTVIESRKAEGKLTLSINGMDKAFVVDTSEEIDGEKVNQKAITVKENGLYICGKTMYNGKLYQFNCNMTACSTRTEKAKKEAIATLSLADAEALVARLKAGK